MNEMHEFGYSVIHYVPRPEIRNHGDRLMVALATFQIGPRGPGKLYIRKGSLEKVGAFGCEEDVELVSDVLLNIGNGVSSCVDSWAPFAKIARLLTFARAVLVPTPVRKARGSSINNLLVNAGFDPEEFDLFFLELGVKSIMVQ